MHIILTTLSFFIVANLFAANAGDKILGTYLTENNQSKVKFYKKDGKYHAKVVWLKEPNGKDSNPFLDKNNPNASLRSRKIVGITFISDLEYKDGEWVNGKIYIPEKGVFANGGFKFLSDGDLQLRAKYMFIVNTKTWKKVKE